MPTHEIDMLIDVVVKEEKPLVLSKKSERILLETIGIDSFDKVLEIPFRVRTETPKKPILLKKLP